MTKYTSSVSPKGQVTIPAPIRKKFGIDSKDTVTLEIVGDAIYITPLKSQIHEYHGRFSSKLGPLDWNEIEKISAEDAAIKIQNADRVDVVESS